MKVFILLTIILFFVFVIPVKSNYLTEDHYTLIKKINNIEIREYSSLLYTSYTPKNERDRNNSFRNVASYIFGGNNRNEQISMTTPVVVKLHNDNEMAFIMPQSYTMDELPDPHNLSLDIYQEPAQLKAVISYSGYTNNRVEQKKIKLLKTELNKLGIEHDDNFEVLIYNSPYEVINRKNEITVGIKNYETDKKNNSLKSKIIYLGGGCFWCIEAVFEGVNGVISVTSGYAGGDTKDPTYEMVSSGITDHAEVCEILYDPKLIKLEDLLNIFFLSHDPTTLNRQGNDIGKHYRSIILYNNLEEKKLIEKYITDINLNLFDNKIVTEMQSFKKFYKAEAYHQDYYFNNKSQPYCNIVISPKLNKVRSELSNYYK